MNEEEKADVWDQFVAENIEQFSEALRSALQGLPMEVMKKSGMVRNGASFPPTAYIGRMRDDNLSTLEDIAEYAQEVIDIIKEVTDGLTPLSVACRKHKMDYVRFRRFCEKFQQAHDGGRHQKNLLPDYEPTMEEVLYGKLYNVLPETVSPMMPEDAEESVDKVLSTLRDREREVLELRLNGMSLNDIGEKHGVSRERIRQIESAAWRKIHNPARLNILVKGIAGVGAEELEAEQLRAQALEEKNRAIEERNAIIKEREDYLANEYSAMDIAELDPSVRLYNCLHRAGISTVGELLKWDYARLGQLRNMGKTSLKELRSALATRGLSLKEG